MTRSALAVAFVVALASLAGAAPPDITHFVRAGVRQGETAEVMAGGKFDNWPVKFLTSDPTLTAVAGEKKGQITVTATATCPPGVYWIRAYTADGVGKAHPFIVGSLPEQLEAEPNDTPAKAQAVKCPAVVNGRLGNNGDVDGYAVDLTKGQTLVAAVAANSRLNSPMDAIVQVVSADGFVLMTDHDTDGLDPRAVFTAPADGRYVVRVFAFPEQPNSSIRFAGGDDYVYRLTLTTGGYADHAWPPAVERGAKTLVRPVGPNIPETVDPVAIPKDAEGIATVSAPGIANVVPVWVEPHPCFVFPAKEPPTPPFTISGRLDQPGDKAAVTFAATKGQRYSVRVLGREERFAITPLLRVLGPDGQQIIRAEPRKPETDPIATFTARADGPHTVEVADLFGHGGPRYLFVLRVLPDVPDFTAGVLGDTVHIAIGKPTDMPVTVTLKNGFKGEVKLRVEGLPPGVTAAPTGKPTTKGANVNTTLRFTADKPVPPMAIRIVAESAGDQPMTRTAIPAFTKPPSPSGQLWLTASKASEPKAKPTKAK